MSNTYGISEGVETIAANWRFIHDLDVSKPYDLAAETVALAQQLGMAHVNA